MFEIVRFFKFIMCCGACVSLKLISSYSSKYPLWWKSILTTTLPQCNKVSERIRMQQLFVMEDNWKMY
jgi:hypothetical protein